jgi:predicted PurR-regulated permease PerM
MFDDRERLRRLLIGAGVGGLFLIVGYTVLVFAAVLVFTIFLYYAIRPIFRFLSRFGLGRRIRATLSIVLFGLPFIALIGYTLVVIVVEVQELLTRRGLFTADASQFLAQLNTGTLTSDSLEVIALDGSQTDIRAFADQLLDLVGLAGTAFVQLLLVVAGTYYLLVDGPRLARWFFDTYDDTGIVRRYAEAVDSELSLALFGNVVNVFITAAISVATFYTYNLFAPSAATVPFPALLAALAGIGSLIPVVGIKIVYIPLCLGLTANAWLLGQLELLVPIGILALVSAVVVDFIPDIIVRAQVSSNETHTGLLLIAYILGPSVFGFYGLFLAPIVLVCTTNAVRILLPYVLSGDRPGVQRTLSEFEPRDDSSD